MAGNVLKFPNNLLKSTLYSRFFIIVIQVLFNQLVPDHQSDAFQSPHKLLESDQSGLDSTVDYFLGGFSRWDGQYFLHIASLGYTHENCLAFFPLFPILVRYLSKIIVLISNFSFLSWNAALISSCILNVIFFTTAAKYLFLLTHKLSGSYQFALKTWQFFCLSPATIFFVSPYSESLFCALTFSGIYHCIEGKFYRASFCFAMSSATRSNGLLNISFFLFYVVLFFFKTDRKKLIFVKNLSSVVVIVVPFLLYQYYAFDQFCRHHAQSEMSTAIFEYLVAENLTVPGSIIPLWCKKSIPLSYSSIQSDYWNVGFLRYFEWKQIPNFLLAIPIMLLTALFSCKLIMANYVTAKTFIMTGVWLQTRRKWQPIFHLEMIMFAIHSSFIALFTLFFAHVQIATRLIGSSSPVVYWVLAWLSTSRFIKENADWKTVWNPCYKLRGSFIDKLVCCYCLSYVMIGTFMFVNHLPWT